MHIFTKIQGKTGSRFNPLQSWTTPSRWRICTPWNEEFRKMTKYWIHTLISDFTDFCQTSKTLFSPRKYHIQPKIYALLFSRHFVKIILDRKMKIMQLFYISEYAPTYKGCFYVKINVFHEKLQKFACNCFTFLNMCTRTKAVFTSKSTFFTKNYKKIGIFQRFYQKIICFPRNRYFKPRNYCVVWSWNDMNTVEKTCCQKHPLYAF